MPQSLASHVSQTFGSSKKQLQVLTCKQWNCSHKLCVHILLFFGWSFSSFQYTYNGDIAEISLRGSLCCFEFDENVLSRVVCVDEHGFRVSDWGSLLEQRRAHHDLSNCTGNVFKCVPGSSVYPLLQLKILRKWLDKWVNWNHLWHFRYLYSTSPTEVWSDWHLLKLKEDHVPCKCCFKLLLAFDRLVRALVVTWSFELFIR